MTNNYYKSPHILPLQHALPFELADIGAIADIERIFSGTILDSETGKPLNAPEAFSVERLRENTNRYLLNELNDITVDSVHDTWAKFHLPVHGTSVDRAISIVNDHTIYSFADLSSHKPEVIANNRLVFTDKLDLQLGLDQYVFLNLGRVHPVEVHPVYFIFPNQLMEESGATVALREIVHFNAIVSREGAFFSMQANKDLTPEKITYDNTTAAAEFFANTFNATDFIEEIFPRFLQKHFPHVYHFTTSLTYPGTSLSYTQVGREVVMHNLWEGPQVMVPSSVPFDRWHPSILVTQVGAQAEQIVNDLCAAGFSSDKIFRMDEAVDLYQKRFSRLSNYENPLERSTYICLALRDLALLAQHNCNNQDYPEHMIAFLSR